jgi:hypothetical protein
MLILQFERLKALCSKLPKHQLQMHQPNTALNNAQPTKRPQKLNQT